jgi:hypothetical protein
MVGMYVSQIGFNKLTTRYNIGSGWINPLISGLDNALSKLFFCLLKLNI